MLTELGWLVNGVASALVGAKPSEKGLPGEEWMLVARHVAWADLAPEIAEQAVLELVRAVARQVGPWRFFAAFDPPPISEAESDRLWRRIEQGIRGHA